MRKFFGIVLIILGWFIATLLAIAAIPSFLKSFPRSSELINKLSFLLGELIAVLLMSLIPFFIIRTGIRLTKKKKTNNYIDKIESIK